MNSEILYALILSTLLLFFLLTIVIMAFFISAKRRASQKAALAETKLMYERELRQVESEVGENLLTHMAREIHDSVGQLHTAMAIQLENLKIDYPEITKSIGALESTLLDSTLQIRSLGRTLNRDYVQQNGFWTSLDLELRRLTSLRKFNVHVE